MAQGKNWLVCASGMTIAAMLHAAPALAQDVPAEDEGLAEIVVTAQKREQSLQDVPISISAVGADTLRDSGATGIAGVAALVPSLSLVANNQPLAQSYRIRGLGSDPSIPTFEPSVALFIDGVYTMDDPQFYNQPGMSAEATLHLTEMGATILGTDAVGWDLPFRLMNAKWQEQGDKQLLWDGHKAITKREAFIVQQLCNLAALPPTGFHVGFFPMKLARCSAAPSRVVAFVPA